MKKFHNCVDAIMVLAGKIAAAFMILALLSFPIYAFATGMILGGIFLAVIIYGGAYYVYRYFFVDDF